MSIMEEAKKTLTLPITGMTCANCVAAVERNLNKLDGVQSANVNLASERASVEFDPAIVDQKDIIARIKRTGYDIALGEARKRAATRAVSWMAVLLFQEPRNCQYRSGNRQRDEGQGGYSSHSLRHIKGYGS